MGPWKTAVGAAERERLILDYQGLVRTVARRYRFTRYPLEDLIGWGNIGLIEAIDHVNLTEPSDDFEGYAARAIANEIRTYIFDHPYWLCKYMKAYLRLKRFTGLSHEEIVARTGIKEGSRPSLECALRRADARLWELHPDQHPLATPIGWQWAEDWEHYQALAGALTPRQRALLHLYFLEGKTVEEIGLKHHCTHQNISYIIRKSVANLAALAAGEPN